MVEKPLTSLRPATVQLKKSQNDRIGHWGFTTRWNTDSLWIIRESLPQFLENSVILQNRPKQFRSANQSYEDWLATDLLLVGDHISKIVVGPRLVANKISRKEVAQRAQAPWDQVELRYIAGFCSNAILVDSYYSTCGQVVYYQCDHYGTTQKKTIY